MKPPQAGTAPQARGSASSGLAEWAKSTRSDFAIFSRPFAGKPLIYLDNAATTQKPTRMADRMHRFYTEEYATIHRGVYRLSHQATQICESARAQTARWIGAAQPEEIIFVRGATEAINLVSNGLSRMPANGRNEIIVTELEHHANFVPWQEFCRTQNYRFRVAPVLDSGDLDLPRLKELITAQTLLVAVAHASNAIGTVHPVKQIAVWAHEKGALCLVDGAQAVPHLSVRVDDLDCDFYCFSAHKVFGPSGLGILYGKKKLLDALPPYQFGGEMVNAVTLVETKYAETPAKFEAGTPAIAEIVGWGETLAFLQDLDRDQAARQEELLLHQLTEGLKKFQGLRILGAPKRKVSLASFVIDGAHPHDIAGILDEEGVAVRAGHHCAQPAMARFKVPATTRASLAFYNTEGDLDHFFTALGRVYAILRLKGA